MTIPLCPFLSAQETIVVTSQPIHIHESMHLKQKESVFTYDKLFFPQCQMKD